jgi:hypothetical protein
MIEIRVRLVFLGFNPRVETLLVLISNTGVMGWVGRNGRVSSLFPYPINVIGTTRLSDASDVGNVTAARDPVEGSLGRSNGGNGNGGFSIRRRIFVIVVVGSLVWDRDSSGSNSSGGIISKSSDWARDISMPSAERDEFERIAGRDFGIGIGISLDNRDYGISL